MPNGSQLSLEFPWPPSINHYWRHTVNGHYISQPGKNFRQLVWLRTLKFKGMFLPEHRLEVNIFAFPPDKRKRDLDNLFKVVLDSLQHAGVYEDDNQIDRLTIERKTPLDGRIEVRINVI